MRTNTSSAWACSALVALAGLLAGGSPARADYREAYKKGVEAAGKGNWEEVARQMRAALAEQGREGEQIKVYGMRYEDYLPHYYLGLALANAGDCAGAVKEWDASQSQGAIQKSPQFKNLQKKRSECDVRLAAAGPPTPSVKAPTPKPAATGPDPAAVAQAAQAAELELSRADEAARGVAALESDPTLAPVWQQDDSLGPAQKRARELLASARSKLDAGKRGADLAPLGEARDLAVRAAQQFERVRQDAPKRREQRLAELKKLDEDRRRAEARPASPPTPPASPSARRGPPAELVQAARAYFDGRYRDAADILVRTTPQSGPPAVQAYLFRAAARHALYLVGGKSDDALRRAALDDVSACRRLDRSFTPDPQAFSPRFVQFFLRGN
jgi:hypothetical protein